MSAATAALARETALRDLGEHRLKDLSAPERIFQLGDGEFPPLKSLYRTNLPVPGDALRRAAAASWPAWSRSSGGPTSASSR